MKLQRIVTVLAVCGAIAGWASTAAALEADFSGYIRAYAGATATKGHFTCFQAPGAESKYRLGNECEQYGEFMFSVPAYKGEDGSKLTVNIMPYGKLPTIIGDTTNITQNAPDSEWGFAQFYIQGEGIPGLAGGKPWVGRKYYKREDVHVIDYFYWNPSGNGGGIEDIGIFGDLKLSYALFMTNPGKTFGAVDIGTPPDSDIVYTVKKPADTSLNALRHDLQLRGIAINPDGELQFGVSFIEKFSKHDAGENGWSVTVQHVQKILGGTNKLAFQYGGGPGTNLGNAGNIFTPTDQKKLRVVESLAFQPLSMLGGQVVVLYQNEKNTGIKDWISVGGRLSYAFAEHVKLLVDVGHDQVKPKTGDTRQLTKFTVAPTIAAAPGFWARPELRLFYTFAVWNDAARNAGVDSAGLYRGTDKTNGSTFGLTAEAWW